MPARATKSIRCYRLADMRPDKSLRGDVPEPVAPEPTVEPTPIPTPTEKTCTLCRIPKPIDEFYQFKSHKNRHSPRCKECIREYQRKQNRLTASEFNKKKESTQV